MRPKAADRLGVVYTPNAIVKFMIEGAHRITKDDIFYYAVYRETYETRVSAYFCSDAAQ